MRLDAKRVFSVLAFVASLAVAIWALYDGYVSKGERLRASVVAVDSSDISEHGLMKYGTETLDVMLLEGPRKGERHKASNVVRAQMELDNFYSVGDTILVTAPTEEGENCMLVARTPWRAGKMAAAFTVFAILLIAFGSVVGINALTSFILCAAIIWKVVVPMVLSGINPSLVAFTATSLMTGVIMLLVGGLTRKALAAFLGSMLGVVAALGLAHLFGALMDINGATLPFAQALVYSGFAKINLADLFIAATIIAASGAMMDLAMDIAAGAAEVALHNQAISKKELFFSALRIGRACVGTMTTTLLLAYSGGFLTLLMVFSAEGIPPAEFINSPIVAAEVVKTLVGSFAIVFVAPFTAFVSSVLFPTTSRF